MVTVLGLSFYFHDSSAVLLRDGDVIAAAAEERFSRVKHDPGFPENAVRFCLEEGRVGPADIDYVVFYEKPFVKFERILLNALGNFPRSYAGFRESMVTWFKDKLWLREQIREKTGVGEDRILFCDHHLSHAASSFLCSPFSDAALLTVDGVGEWTTTAMGYGKDNKVCLTKEIRFPDSLGLLYSTFTAFLGFEVNEGEYKVMGMAPYGKPRHVDRIRKLVSVRPDGSFSLDMDYFAYQYSTEKSFSKKFLREFGPPRDPAAPEERDEYYADIAASIQALTEEIMVTVCRALHAAYPSPRLCLAGGVALNCVANKRILEETPFRELYVQPSAGDGGGALGAALYVHHHVLGNKRRFRMEHAYWGKGYGSDEIRRSLSGRGAACREFADSGALLKHAAERLARGEVIGWFQGRGEWGPRALGNRSILADPRKAGMKDIINRKVKFREPFRPFAPAVLRERSRDWFEVSGDIDQYPYRFMLLVGKVREEKRDLIPAVTHVDGTARLQTVSGDTNPLFYGLLREFDSLTGVPVLLNTSFNLKGEPIVNSPEDALKTFYASGLDALVIDTTVVVKE